jgi:FKBP12-rapamycin complex-associated protein
VIHVDFGDCFEVAQQREKFPERIPFRLTRMLVLCMEVSGVEGVYKRVCEQVMRVLRENKESVMAVLEAFVYDPLLGWRLLNIHKEGGGAGGGLAGGGAVAQAAGGQAGRGEEGELPVDAMSLPQEPRAETDLPTPTPSTARPYRPLTITEDGVGGGKAAVRQASGAAAGEEDDKEQETGSMNAKALSVIARVEAKLLGNDFDMTGGVMGGKEQGASGGAAASTAAPAAAAAAAAGTSSAASGPLLDVRSQVERLISEATSHVNLCQCYVGWCPFW